ncbi:Uncharacterised protein [Vibrio cholerae]|nr:Uncharacterised protein [Vibrio cholerae]CSI38361.1 Uncharacterised protein [Vibrio cholerae]
MLTAKILFEHLLCLTAQLSVVTLFGHIHHATEETSEWVFTYKQAQ